MWIYHATLIICSIIATTALFLLVHIYPSLHAASCTQGSHNCPINTLNTLLLNTQHSETTQTAEQVTQNLVNSHLQRQLELTHANHLPVKQCKYCTSWHHPLAMLKYDIFTHFASPLLETPTPTNALDHVVKTDARLRYDANAILIIWGQIMALAIFTIWARTVGPRLRLDQMSSHTWKDFLPFLIGVALLSLSGML